MKTKCSLSVGMIILVFVVGLAAGLFAGTARHRSTVIRMEEETSILKNEIERYKTVIRDIRSTTNEAMPIEMSPAASEQGQ